MNLSLQEAIHQALSVNPQLAMAQGRVEDARGQRVQAGLSPNPRLVLQSEDVRFWGSQPHSFANTTEDYGYIGQVIESGGKRLRRLDVATSGEHRAQLDQELTRRQLAVNVATAYWSAAGAARIRDLLQENLQTYREDVRYGRNRVQEGVMAEADLMRIELERDRVQIDALAGAREADQAMVNLYRALGKSDFPQTVLTDSLDNVHAATIPELTHVLQIRPELLMARETVNQAEANVRLQRANARTDPQVFAGYKRTIGLDTLYGAVQIDLPLRNRNQGNIGSAEAQVRVAQASLRATEAGVKADVEAATRAYQDEQLVLDTLPATKARAQEAERLARSAYREGAIDLLRLLDAERNRIEVEVQYYRALVGVRQSVVNLMVAGGESMAGSVTP